MEGNHLKTISKTDEELRVGNYMVLFGGKDAEGDYFTPEKEFESDYTKTGYTNPLANLHPCFNGIFFLTVRIEMPTALLEHKRVYYIKNLLPFMTM